MDLIHGIPTLVVGKWLLLYTRAILFLHIRHRISFGTIRRRHRQAR